VARTYLSITVHIHAVQEGTEEGKANASIAGFTQGFAELLVQLPQGQGGNLLQVATALLNVPRLIPSSGAIAIVDVAVTGQESALAGTTPAVSGIGGMGTGARPPATKLAVPAVAMFQREALQAKEHHKKSTGRHTLR
jgi:hypothetical protein